MKAPSSTAVALVIWKREMIRFYRQPSRIAAAIGTPVMLWVFLGVGLARSFDPDSADASTGSDSYALFLLPGMITMVALFSAIFSSISIIEDRNEGWLQSVLISPAPRTAIVLGKVIGGASVAFVQATLLLLAPPVWSHYPSAASLVLVLLAIALTATMMTSIGLAFAWKCESSQGFHAVMNLVLMPMWALSGSIFPIENQHSVLEVIMKANPLSWCSIAIRSSWFDEPDVLAFVIASVLTVLAITVAVLIVTKPEKGVRQ